MSSFTFYSAIPQPTDQPSQSQGQILQNFTSIGDPANSWVTQDHYGFGTGTDGQHKQVTLPTTVSAVAQTALSSVISSAPGVALSSAPQLFYQNSQSSFQLSAIRAWAYCNNSGTIQSGQSSNVASVVHPSAGIYNVTLSSNAVNSNNFAVFATGGVSLVGGLPTVVTATPNGVGTFQLRFTVPSPSVVTDPVTFSFVVLQI